MPYPYGDFPTRQVWEEDSTVFFSTLPFRSADPTLGLIDEFVSRYHDPALRDARLETLYYLLLAIRYWESKLNRAPANLGTPQDNITGRGLPDDQKVRGAERRREAIRALKVITGKCLGAETRTSSVDEAMQKLEENYQRKSHGGTTSSPGPDQDQIASIERIKELAIFLDEAHMQRRYKLRFRAGVAWRWSEAAAANVIYDSTSNAESEANDEKVHFVMSAKGRLYAGFRKDVLWFKHSSFLGGANVLCAGRMKIKMGRITEIENDSGHYHPGILQMRNILQRLRLYGCNTEAIEFQRIDCNPKRKYTAAEIAGSNGEWPAGVPR